MVADQETRDEIVSLVEATYEALSTPDSAVGEFFSEPDIAVAGSGVGELFNGPEIASSAARVVASRGFTWKCDSVTLWRHGDVAWGQILSTVHVTHENSEEAVPYLTTGVFGRESGGWRWLYWGGSEPQNPPRV
jgi:hypothetical protein